MTTILETSFMTQVMTPGSVKKVYREVRVKCVFKIEEVGQLCMEGGNI